jgi:hypothetical protein
MRLCIGLLYLKNGIRRRLAVAVVVQQRRRPLIGSPKAQGNERVREEINGGRDKISISTRYCTAAADDDVCMLCMAAQ